MGLVAQGVVQLNPLNQVIQELTDLVTMEAMVMEHPQIGAVAEVAALVA